MESSGMLDTLVDRLKLHPPLDRLSRDQLKDLASGLKLRYLEANEVVFRQGETPAEECYLVHKGLVRVVRTEEGEERLLDLCEEGDFFGVRALLQSRDYAADARVAEDSLLYVLSSSALLRLVRADSRMQAFFDANMTGDLALADDQGMESVANALRHLNAPELLVDIQPNRDVVHCAPDISVREAAQRMRDRDVGSILVTAADGRALGIVTDSDLRSKVVAEGLSGLEPVSKIMSSPVVTVAERASEASLLAAMMKHQVHHFAVTEDGTPDTPVTGVLSEHDLFKAKGQHPTVILNEVRKAHDGHQLRMWRDRTEDLLRSYLEAETAMSLVSRVVSEVNDALIRRSLELATEAMGRPPRRRFCWLALGSEGREEQLLRTDQDNALMVDDEASGLEREDFMELGSRVVQLLVDAGFSRCPGDVMASQPDWNLTETEWKERFARWIEEPDNQATMRTNISFDLRPVAGDLTMGKELKRWILNAVRRDRGFLTFFAKSAEQSPPPLSFFRNEIVERSGAHRSTFDIKARAMMPLADAARVLVHQLGVEVYGSTADRWRAVADAEPGLARLAREAAMAYEILMRFRAREGLARGDSGRYVAIRALNKIERRTLRSTFAVVEDVQLMLRSRFRLDMIR